MQGHPDKAFDFLYLKTDGFVIQPRVIRTLKAQHIVISINNQGC